MRFSVLELVLWAAGAACHLLVLMIILKKKRIGNAPIFVLYLALAPTDSLMLFLIQHLGTKHAYFLAYWISGFAEYVLHICVAVEITRNVLRPLNAWMKDSWKGLLLWFTVGTSIAITLAFGVGRSSVGYAGLSTFERWEVHTSVFRSLAICGLVLTTYSIANRFYLQVGKHRLAILLGLFVWSYTALLADVSNEMFGWNRISVVVDSVQKFVYIAVLLYWAPVFWKPETEQQPLPPEAIAKLAALHDSVRLDLTKLGGAGR